MIIQILQKFIKITSNSEQAETQKAQKDKKTSLLKEWV